MWDSEKIFPVFQFPYENSLETRFPRIWASSLFKPKLLSYQHLNSHPKHSQTLSPTQQHMSSPSTPTLLTWDLHLNSHVQWSQSELSQLPIIFKVQNSDWGREINSARSLIDDTLLSSIWHFYSDSFCSDLTLQGKSIVKISGKILSERPQIRTDCYMLYPTLLPAAPFLRCRSLARSGQAHFWSLANCLAKSSATLEWQLSIHSKDLPVTGKQNTAVLNLPAR